MRIFLIILFLFVTLPLLSQENVASSETITSFFNTVKVSGQWFFVYLTENDHEKSHDEFILRRGYLTTKKSLNENLSVRITQDVAVDRQGDGEGDVEIRLKYGYLKYKQKKLFFLTDAFIEFGVVHRPWIDFEQKINRYRVQGKMFLERQKISRSADYGLTLGASIGGKMDQDYINTVNKNYPGKYGSVSFGIYNGGGYEAIEKNKNKLFEGRLSIRPLPEMVAGFQMSLLGNYGKGNSSQSPKFISHAVMGSFENEGMVLTAMYYAGLGDIDGNAINADGDAIDQSGFSVFMEKQIIFNDLHLFARYDEFDSELTSANWTFRRYIGGMSYYFYKGSKILLDFDLLNKKSLTIDESWITEIAVEVKF